MNASRRMFVGNLPFDVDSTALKEAAEQYGHVVWARVVVNHDQTHRPSKGYGFIECLTTDDAEVIFAALDGSSLGGRQLRVAWSESKNKTWT